MISDPKHGANPKIVDVKRKDRKFEHGSNDDVDTGAYSGKPWNSDLQDVGSKSPKMKNFPQMLLSDSKLKRSKLMTRRESQALLEGVRKNRGVQSTQSCNN